MSVMVILVVVSALVTVSVQSVLWREICTHVSTGVRVGAGASKQRREPASVMAIVLMVMVMTGSCYATLANNNVNVWGCNSRDSKACENKRVLHSG